MRAQDEGLDDALAINTEHIAERTRVLVEAAATTPWAGHVDPLLPDREQALAAIAVYRDRYDIEDPSPLGPRPVEVEVVRLTTWSHLGRALSTHRSATTPTPSIKTTTSAPLVNGPGEGVTEKHGL